MELRSAFFALSTFVGLIGASSALLRLLGVPLGNCIVFRGAFAFPLGLVTLLRHRRGVGLGLLAVTADLTANPLLRTLMLQAPTFTHPPDGQQRNCDDDHNNDHDGDDDGC